MFYLQFSKLLPQTKKLSGLYKILVQETHKKQDDNSFKDEHILGEVLKPISW